MKKILAILTLVSFCAFQQASAQNDPKAKEILQSVSKKVNGLKSLKANFSFSLINSAGKVTDTQKGSFTMKGQKYTVMLSGQEIICDGKTVWTYNKDAKEVQVSSYNPDEQTISPAKLFTNFYDKEYKYSYKGEQKDQGKSCNVIEMVPTAKGKQFSKIDLMIDKATSTIVGGNITEKNGNKYKYEVSNYTPNAKVTDASFTFDAKAHKGVDVVDLR